MSRYIVTTVSGYRISTFESQTAGNAAGGLTAQVCDVLGGCALVREWRSENAPPRPRGATPRWGDERKRWAVREAEQHAARLNEEYEAWLLT